MLKINNSFKIVFDLFLFILLAAVYCAQPTGIPIHEYIGTGIYILFIIHLAYNYKWIIYAGKKLFDRTVGIRIKFMYAVDALLLATIIVIGLSGIMISHVIFKLGIMPVWRPLHSIASAVSIVLLTIHIGIHGNMIINTVKNKIRLPFLVTKIAASVVFVIILCAGIYGDVVSKTGPVGNQYTGRPRFETVLALFERSVNLLSGPPEYVRNRAAGGINSESNENNGTESRGAGRNNPGSGENNGTETRETGRNNPRSGGNNAIETSEEREWQGPPRNNFNLNVFLISVSNYLAFILLCSIFVFLIDTKIKKCSSSRKRKALETQK